VVIKALHPHITPAQAADIIVPPPAEPGRACSRPGRPRWRLPSGPPAGPQRVPLIS
jgi:hypothetical protein